jgi:hypothetical protein
MKKELKAVRRQMQMRHQFYQKKLTSKKRTKNVAVEYRKSDFCQKIGENSGILTKNHSKIIYCRLFCQLSIADRTGAS